MGSNLRQSHAFDGLYNTSNIHELRGASYDLVVSSANRADSFRINAHGDDDRAEIEELIATIRSASIRKLVLISTVCVYPEGGEPNESTPLSPENLTPYGQNRLFQEQALQESFDTLTVRLPQLYGDNLKKGVVYDLANDYRVEYINPEGIFQHYDVRHLWADIEVALEAGLSELNIATAPIRNDVLAQEVFGRDLSGYVPPETVNPFAAMYTRNMTTEHAALFGASGPYLVAEDDELRGLAAFAAELREG